MSKEHIAHNKNVNGVESKTFDSKKSNEHQKKNLMEN